MKRIFNEHLIRKATSLDGSWKFSIDPSDVGEKEGWQKKLPSGDTVVVPSCWNNELRLLNYTGAAWYEKEFYTDGGTLRFEFESVMSEANVYLDGEKIGYHYGAFTQFEIIVRDVKKGYHTLTVKADNRQDQKSIPQAKVDWFNYGGIARSVQFDELKGISVLKNHVKYTLSSDLKDATVCAEVELYNAENEKISTNLTVTVGENTIYSGEISLEGGENVTFTTDEVTLKDVKLWDCDTPTLYDVCAKTDTDDLKDRIHSVFQESGVAVWDCELI